MQQEQRLQDQQRQELFGGFNNGPFGGIEAKPVKSEIETIRTKMMAKHDEMVKDLNKCKDSQMFLFKQKALIDQLQTLLTTYGWSFGDNG